MATAPAAGAPMAGAPMASAPAPNVERVIGRNILPFLAAAMVFVGLIFLAVLVVPIMGASSRFAAMLALSVTIFGVGLLLARRSPSTFSIALLGTGVGALFISILMTRLHFGYLGDAATFALLLAWTAGAMALVKAFDSLTLSVTAHAGMAISILVAFTLGFDTSRAPLVLAYQLAASALVIGASLLTYRRTYLLGLSVSLVMTLIASLAISFNLWDSDALAVNIVSYLIQFVTASVLSFLLATSTAKLDEDSRMALHVGNKSVWALVVFTALDNAVSLVFSRAGSSSLGGFGAPLSEHAGSLACIVAFLGHAALSVALERGGRLPAPMARFSAIGMLALAALVCAWDAGWASSDSLASVPALFIIALVAAGAARALGEREYAILALVLLGFDAVLALFFPHSSAAIQLGWSVAIMATGAALYLAWPPRGLRQNYLPMLVLAELVFFETAVAGAASRLMGLTGNTSMLVLVIGVLTALRAFEVEQRLRVTKDQFVGFAINEYLACVIALPALAYGNGMAPYKQALEWIAVALLIAISLLRILQTRHAGAFGATAIQSLSAAILTFAMQAPLAHLIPLGDTTPFIASVVAMLAALVLVGLGFALRMKPVRLFGLAMVLLTVLKMTIVDVASISTIGRVIAFIVGGLIAFGISALYAFADKRLGASAAPAGPAGPVSPTGPASPISTVAPTGPALAEPTAPAGPVAPTGPAAGSHNFGSAAF